MKQKLDFLKRYTMKKDGYVRLISDVDISLINKLPDFWYDIFKEKDVKNRINILMNIWEANLGTELSNTISYLREYLEDVELMEINGRLSILYTIRNRLGKILYYEGRNPMEDFNHEVLEKAWNQIPNSIRIFYEKIHNGFYYYASGSMGLLSKDEVTYLGDDDLEWGIIEDLKEPLQIDFKTSFGFFSNGMGTYIAIDYKNCEGGKATLWSTKNQPLYNINFWDFVDEWIVIGFDV